MNKRKKIIAICGSTRSSSSNLYLIKAIAALTADIFTVDIFAGLMQMPPFNPDDDTESPPTNVVAFRKRIHGADGILICTPEYAMGVPGVLKNAIDWTVSSSDFSKKPTALITASSSGQKAHHSLVETLRVVEADLPDETQLLISFIKTKVSSDGKIIDAATAEQINHLIKSFAGLMNEEHKTR